MYLPWQKLLMLTSLTTPTPSSPRVIIRNGTVVGSTQNEVDSFLGIPYAKPPVGPLRLRRSQPLDTSFGTFNATSLPRACSQVFPFNVNQTVPAFQAAAVNNPQLQTIVTGIVNATGETYTGEDCLLLNVQRSSNTTDASRLPVLFWIHGGGWEFGSTQFYDATQLLHKAAALGHPFIFVAINYRLGAFGFLPGREAQAEGNTNLGIHDQRLAMRWVQENIEAFGGDPDKVTLWGESAGGVSTFIHILANGGNTDGLFRAAIMDSGMAYNALPVDSGYAQQVFDQVVDYCNCTAATDKMSCLRSTPYDVFQGANLAQPNLWDYQSLALVWTPRPDSQSSLYPTSPYDSLRKGAFARVPIISGNQEDEGTLWSIAGGLDTISTTDQVISYFTTWWPTAARRTVASFVKTYPADPAAGSPFDTGTANQLYGAYKRVAAIIGDWFFTLARRICLHYMTDAYVDNDDDDDGNGNNHTPPAIYSYIQTFFHDALPVLGTFHASDIFVDFEGVLPDVQAAVLTYYTSFVHYTDPNRLVDRLNASYGRTVWPRWTDRTGVSSSSSLSSLSSCLSSPSPPLLLNFGANHSSLIPDTFRQSSYRAFLASADELRVI